MKLPGLLGFGVGGLFLLTYMLGAGRGSLALAVVFFSLGLMASMITQLPKR